MSTLPARSDAEFRKAINDAIGRRHQANHDGRAHAIDVGTGSGGRGKAPLRRLRNRGILRGSTRDDGGNQTEAMGNIRPNAGA